MYTSAAAAVLRQLIKTNDLRRRKGITSEKRVAAFFVVRRDFANLHTALASAAYKKSVSRACNKAELGKRAVARYMYVHCVDRRGVVRDRASEIKEGFTEAMRCAFSALTTPPLSLARARASSQARVCIYTMSYRTEGALRFTILRARAHRLESPR